MGAPLNNQFWKLRSKHGRDAIFTDPDKLWESACEYFQWCEDNPFYESEQRKGNIIIQKGADVGDLDISPIVELPKMRPFTIHGLCRFLGVNTKYFNDFKLTCSKEFSEVLTRVMDIIYEQKFSGAASGFLNPNIIARDLGLKDVSDVNLNDQRKATADVFPDELDSKPE